MIWNVGIFVYVLVLFLGVLGSVNTSNLDTSTYWVKVIFGQLLLLFIFLV